MSEPRYLGAKPEHRDWCSRWPDGSYGSCCKRHDWRYAQPGDRHDRARADRELRTCVTEKAGAFMGWVMWLGVRAGGWTPWHFNRTIFGRKLDDDEFTELDGRYRAPGSHSP